MGLYPKNCKLNPNRHPGKQNAGMGVSGIRSNCSIPTAQWSNQDLGIEHQENNPGEGSRARNFDGQPRRPLDMLAYRYMCPESPPPPGGMTQSLRGRCAGEHSACLTRKTAGFVSI